MAGSWRAAYHKCLRVGVDSDALARLGRGIGDGTPSAQWNAGQAALADLLFTLTAALVDLYPPDRVPFTELAAHYPDDGILVARWTGVLLELLAFFDLAVAKRLRAALVEALRETPETSDGGRAPA